MAATKTYVIRGGVEGRERLRVLARVMWPTTEALLARVGTPRDARCLDIGCGGGDVIVELARRAADGFAVGADLDEVKVEIARADAAAAGVTNAEFRNDDVMAGPAGDERFDVIYARFLLTHLPDPTVAAAAMRERLAPGGVLIVEDIDYSGHFCEPSSDAFWRYVDLYTAVVQARGCDPNIGPRLPGLLRGAGLTDLGMNVIQPAGFDGDAPLLVAITLEAIADAVLEAGLATTAELNATVDDLYAFVKQEGTVVSGPRVVQAWGRLTSVTRRERFGHPDAVHFDGAAVGVLENIASVLAYLVGTKTTSSQPNSATCTAPIQRISMRRQVSRATNVVSAGSELTMSHLPHLADRAANRRLLDRRRQRQHFVFRNPVGDGRTACRVVRANPCPTTKPDHTSSFGRAIEIHHG
jgi:SAM-dependent methyltransferase